MIGIATTGIFTGHRDASLSREGHAMLLGRGPEASARCWYGEKVSRSR
jgi:hypothetical protein